MRFYQIREAGNLDCAAIADRDIPRPGPGEVLVRTHAVSLNYRDLAIALGRYARPLKMPLVPLSDGAGEVVDTGEGVSRVKLGDRVAGIFMQRWLDGPMAPKYGMSALGGALDGMLSEYVILHEDGLVRIPDHLSFEEGAALPCAGVTAWNALTSADLRPGTTVLALGTGGVSIFALQFARLAGARVIVISKSDAKLKRAIELGASDGINYTVEKEWDRVVADLTGGDGVDHVVEVGGPGTLARSLNAVRLGGRVSLIGVLSGVGAMVDPMPVLGKQIELHGVFVGSRAMFESMNRALALHKLRPVIDETFRFGEYGRALAHMASGGHFGKIVVRVD